MFQIQIVYSLTIYSLDHTVQFNIRNMQNMLNKSYIKDVHNKQI